MKPLLSFVLVFGSVIASAQQFVDAGGTSGVPISPASVHVDQKLGNQVPMTPTFRDMAGNEVRFSQLDSQRPIIILPLFYRCHGVCSLEFENLISTLDRLKTIRAGRDYDVVVLGIDPTEGPDLAKSKFEEAEKEFPRLMSGPGWHFLTGDLQSIRSITNALGFYFTYDPQKDLINHPSGLMFLTSAGKVSSYVLGPEYSTQILEHGIRVAGQSQVGAKVQDVLFGCVHIDPLTGKRSFVFEKLLRITGIAFLFIAVGGVALLSRKGHVPKQA